MKLISKSILKNLIKQEQLKLPLGEDSEEAPIDERIMEAWSGTKVHEILNERNKPLSGRELYAYLISDNFDHQSHRDVTRLFEHEDTEKNIPEQSTQEALDLANDLIKRPDADPNKKKRADRVLTSLLRYSKLPSSTYEKILSSKDNPYTYEDNDPELSESAKDYMKNDRILDVSRNRHLQENHHLMAVENHPGYINELLTNNDELKNNERLVNHILSKDHIFNKIRDDRVYGIAKWHQDNLHPNNVKKLIEHPSFDKNVTHHEVIDKLLDKLSPEDRKSYIDRKLGIEGGNVFDPEKAEEDHWDNWHNGEGYSRQVVKLLPRSRHLDDSHAEHIKRHGDFDQKYDMYHKNKDIDPRHGIEMFNKWKNDDDHHGYSANELNERNREEFDDVYTHENLPQDVKERILEEGYDSGAIDEAAGERYGYHDYLNSLDDDEVLKIMGSEYDDIDEIHEKLTDEYHWHGENPNSKQNIGRTDFDALDKLAQKYDRDHAINLDDFEEVTGHKHPSEIGLPELYNEKRDYIDMEDVHNKLDEYGGASEIDYANHDNFSIADHPDYDDRFQEAANKWRLDRWGEDKYDIADSNYLYEKYREHPDYEQAFEQAKKDYLEENSADHIAELYDNSHEEPEFVPEHLHPHIPDMAQLAEAKKKKIRDGGHRDFLNQQIPQRMYDHEYGENQHHYELAKDYADAKNGSVDIGTLHKVFPNQKETWKKLFGDKGKLSSDEIQQKINEIPKTKYDISYEKWGKDKIQNTNGQDEIVFRLDHSPESLKAIEQDPEVYRTFQKVQELSHRSGHPTNKNTIAWARVDFSDPKNPLISELQSDYGKTVREYLKNNDRPEAAAHIEQIENHHKNWRENLLNFVIKTAKKHGAEKIFTHSPESKSKHTGDRTVHSVYKDSYGKVPRNMGFKPVDMKDMPLTDSGKEHFIGRRAESPETRADRHIQASMFHYGVHSLLDPSNPTTKALRDHHKSMAYRHQEAANTHVPDGETYVSGIGLVSHKGKLPMPSIDDEHTDAVKESPFTGKPATHAFDSIFDKPLDEGETLQGHVFDLKPQVMKKNIDLAITLIKAETLLVKKHLKNQDVVQDKINILKIQNMLGYDNL